ncbi:hypothetical protein DQZ30_16595 [Salmonella enterica subsp. diarizonae]|nr:hypothetical protein [Salmonella enterica subsp. diarizonae]
MSDIQGTLVSVSLDQLRAFDLNPRIIRNPNYDEIKTSIRNRGLEHPPQITQRPGETFYIIASGGNTRLSILHELWLETHDKKYWDITCYFREWQPDKSIEEGNLHCLLGHIIENEVRGSLTFIERALAIQNAINLFQNMKKKNSQKDVVEMLCQEGYSVSPTLLSIMSATIKLLFPWIPELLYSGLSRKNIERLLTLRTNTEKFWDKFCQELPSETEHQLPLFDDIFAMALTSFNGPVEGFSLEHIQDELTGLISQTLNIDYNTVALVTDAQAQKRSIIFGTDPVPELPDISEQRRVALKYQDKKNTEAYPQRSLSDDIDNVNDEDTPAMSDIEPEDSQDNIFRQSSSEFHHSQGTPVSSPVIQKPSSPAFFPDDSPQFDTPESLASVIDQTAWELAADVGLEFLILPGETGVFDIAPADSTLTNESKIYWQILAFLAGKLPGSAVIWRQMLIGTPDSPAGFSEETLTKIFQLICFIRRLYEIQQQGEIS